MTSSGNEAAYHAQSDDGNDGLDHDDRSTDNVLVSNPSKTECEEDGREVRRSGEEL